MEAGGFSCVVCGGATLSRVPRESAELESRGVLRMPGVWGIGGVQHQQAVSLI